MRGGGREGKSIGDRGNAVRYTFGVLGGLSYVIVNVIACLWIRYFLFKDKKKRVVVGVLCDETTYWRLISYRAIEVVRLAKLYQ